MTSALRDITRTKEKISLPGDKCNDMERKVVIVVQYLLNLSDKRQTSPILLNQLSTTWALIESMEQVTMKKRLNTLRHSSPYGVHKQIYHNEASNGVFVGVAESGCVWNRRDRPVLTYWYSGRYRVPFTLLLRVQLYRQQSTTFKWVYLNNHQIGGNTNHL